MNWVSLDGRAGWGRDLRKGSYVVDGRADNISLDIGATSIAIKEELEGGMTGKLGLKESWGPTEDSDMSGELTRSASGVKTNFEILALWRFLER